MRGEQETVLAERVDAPWLTPGGRAQVVLGGRPRVPMCLVRLLLRQNDRVFCIPRDDSGKLDLPTRPVALGDLDGTGTVTDLAIQVTGREHDARFLGAVRQVVGAADADYPWPQPTAYFGVWAVEAEPRIPGSWLRLEDPESPLPARHWFPLLQGDGLESQ